MGFEGLYEVSNRGSVRSLSRKFIRSDGSPYNVDGRILKPQRLKGYMRVKLNNRGEFAQKFVHVLMLEAFMGPRPEGAVSCHWNDVKEDNRIENLRWGTRADNGDDMVRNGHGVHSNKTHCPQGHEYTPGNTYVRRGSRNGKPARQCKTCDRESQRKRRVAMTDTERDAWHAKRRAKYHAGKAN